MAGSAAGLYRIGASYQRAIPGVPGIEDASPVAEAVRSLNWNAVSGTPERVRAFVEARAALLDPGAWAWKKAEEDGGTYDGPLTLRLSYWLVESAFRDPVTTLAPEGTELSADGVQP